ncbi:MAG: UbiA family prenyltransferase [bacterium]|nr:UbiA family prenyltransferase [bacterium]
MLLGVLLAFFYRPELFGPGSAGQLVSAFFATCIIASSNYVLNEILDAPLDRLHPTKRDRPAANGDVRPWLGLLEWGALGLIGIQWAFAINGPFGASALALWVMGCLYNIPPVRTKEVPYLDVVSESINNPIRLLLGWFALVPDRMPPMSLSLSYWMVGAFFMATKRFAEYRTIDDPKLAASYRRSFRAYDEAKLLASMVFYVAAGTLFAGVFIVRYKLELVLCVPFVAGFFGYYVRLGLQPESPVQTPEKLYRQRGFVAFAVVTTVLFVVLMCLEIPGLYTLFNVDATSFEPLWRIGH